MSFSNNPYWPLNCLLAKSTAGVSWSSSNPTIQLFGHPLKIKELIDQISYWASYDFPTNTNPPDGWIECKAILLRLHEAFLISNYLMTKIAFSILHDGHAYRHYKAELEKYWETSNEQYKELTRLLKKAEQDTFRTLQLRQPIVRDRLIPLHQSGMVGFELMPTFSKLLIANHLFTGLAVRVKSLTEEVQTVLQDPGDYSSPPGMSNAEFHEVLTRIANSSTAARRSGHASRVALAISNISNSSQQSIDPMVGMSAMTLGDPTDAPTEGEMLRMLEYAAEAESDPESETAEERPMIQKVKSYQPLVVTPSERRLRRMRSHSGVIVDENENAAENNEDK